MPSLRNIILISDESKPGTIRFNQFCSDCADGNAKVQGGDGQRRLCLDQDGGRAQRQNQDGRRLQHPGLKNSKSIFSNSVLQYIVMCFEYVLRYHRSHPLLVSSSPLERRATPRVSPSHTTTSSTTPSTSVIALATMRRFCSKAS